MYLHRLVAACGGADGGRVDARGGVPPDLGGLAAVAALHLEAVVVEDGADAAAAVQEAREEVAEDGTAAAGHGDGVRRPDVAAVVEVLAEVRVDAGAVRLEARRGDEEAAVGVVGRGPVGQLALVEEDAAAGAVPAHLLARGVLHGEAVGRDARAGDHEAVVAGQLVARGEVVLLARPRRLARRERRVVGDPEPHVVEDDAVGVDADHGLGRHAAVISRSADAAVEVGEHRRRRCRGVKVGGPERRGGVADDEEVGAGEVLGQRRRR
eukprot:CAMPEP_0118867834 /NCGR_PEP_ID=MMETSP1163-20130328/11291_1 /TAXON_ID=124430 /ORGANISM="Phaeomonas parva, Strain CCMP2877" /LENGTH=266 /DNA_ID=CAMNT_0006802303 /DNA_START=275 /DNA_END=1072 /DNA_ORIENTATION=-